MKKNRSFKIKTLARINKEKKDFFIRLAVIFSEMMLFIVVAAILCGFVLFIGK
jgi:hypothetical protein